ncbi:MAG: GNAT family N-acetyltransferase [Pseudomonadota bacterium]
MTALLTHVPSVETERLILRGWDEDDVDTMIAIFTDEETMTYLGGVANDFTAWRAVAGQIGHWAMRGYGFFAIEEKQTAACIGWCGPWFPRGWPDREIGWTLKPGHRGKGYATEAAHASLHFAYTELGWQSAISLIDKDNAPSIAVAERLGASREQSDAKVTDFTCDIYRHLPAEEFLKHAA